MGTRRSEERLGWGRSSRQGPEARLGDVVDLPEYRWLAEVRWIAMQHLVPDAGHYGHATA
jgi:hypothetical protein